MPYNAEPGKVAYVTAGVDVRHGALACDDGFCGTAVKQKTPAADTVRASRDLIVAGEAYLLLIAQVVEAPRAGALASVVKGDLVYITAADNTLATTSGAGKQVLGRVASLPGERGTPSDKVRINLRQKV
jgi:hypothetical protein